MKRIILIVLFVLLLALWISSSLRHQSSMGQEERTVQAQITAVARPTGTH